MKKYLLAGFLILLAGGIFLLYQKKPAIKQNSAATSTTAINPVKEFTMTAKQWAFDPEVITVKKGDSVRIKIKSIDVSHGFSLPDYGFDQELEPGKEVTVEFIASKKGEFTFFCSFFCGQGHRDMKGKLVVE